MTPFIAVVIGLLGATFGSFLSVVVHRIRHKQKGIFFGKSVCPHCKKRLKWNHLIPVMSFLALRGKCAFCEKRISKHYFTLELTTGLLFILVFLNWNFLIELPGTAAPLTTSYNIDWKIFEVFTFYIIETILLMGIFFYDLLYKEIPDRLSLPAIAVGIAAAVLFGGPSLASIGIGVLIIAVFFGGQILVSKGAWLGGGDLRLGVLLAVLLGWKLLVVALILSYFLGAIVSIGLLLSKKADRKTAIPFGPFLIIGGFAAIFNGADLISLYFNLIGW